MRRWERTIGAGTLLEVTFEHPRTGPAHGLVFEVDRGRLAWDEQGEEGRSLRVWADRHDSVVLRLTGRFARVGLTVWHAYMDVDELDGDVVREGPFVRVEEIDGVAVLECRDDFVARIGVHKRTPHRERASSE